MTAAKQIDLYTHGLSFEFSANNTGAVSGGSIVANTAALAAAKSSITSKATALGKGSIKLKQMGNGGGLGGRRGFASASVALSESVMSAPQAPVSAKVRLRCVNPLCCFLFPQAVVPQPLCCGHLRARLPAMVRSRDQQSALGTNFYGFGSICSKAGFSRCDLLHKRDA